MGRRSRQKHLANELMPHHHPVQFRESCRQSGVAMRRIILSVFGGLLAAALLISPAHAVKPVIVEEETIRFDGTPILDRALSEACGFPVTVSVDKILDRGKP
jgi:hypothetical protein